MDNNLMTTSTGCPTWGDHDFQAGCIATTGVHPVMGPYQVVATRCRNCGKTYTETRWTRPHREFYRVLPSTDEDN